jgi:hypothetical protein
MNQTFTPNKFLIATSIMLCMQPVVEYLYAVLHGNASRGFTFFTFMLLIGYWVPFLVIRSFIKIVNGHRLRPISIRPKNSFKIFYACLLIAAVMVPLYYLYAFYGCSLQTVCYTNFALQYRNGNITNSGLYFGLTLYVIPICILCWQLLTLKPFSIVFLHGFLVLLFSALITGLRFPMMLPLLAAILMIFAETRINYQKLFNLFIVFSLILLLLFIPKYYMSFSSNTKLSRPGFFDPVLRINYSSLVPESVNFIGTDQIERCLFSDNNNCSITSRKNELQPLMSRLNKYHPIISYFNQNLTGIAIPLPLLLFYNYGVLFAVPLAFIVILLNASLFYAFFVAKNILRLLAGVFAFTLMLSLVEDFVYIETAARSLWVTLLLAPLLFRSNCFAD